MFAKGLRLPVHRGVQGIDIAIRQRRVLRFQPLEHVPQCGNLPIENGREAGMGFIRSAHRLRA
jgi:hypothetical protein